MIALWRMTLVTLHTLGGYGNIGLCWRFRIASIVKNYKIRVHTDLLGLYREGDENEPNTRKV